MSIQNDQTSQLTSRVYHSSRFQESSNRRDDQRPAWLRTGDVQRSVRRRGAAIYLLGMLMVTMIGSASVIGGMMAKATGLTAVALAAAMPVAGLVWAIVLSVLQRRE